VCPLLNPLVTYEKIRPQWPDRTLINIHRAAILIKSDKIIGMPKTVERLIEQFIPSEYNLHLDISMRTERTFEGNVTIKGQLPSSSDTVKLHTKGLEVLEAKINNIAAKVSYDQAKDQVTLLADTALGAGECEVILRFTGKITDPMHGLYPCYFEHEGKKKELIATQFESHHAREVFPCVDEPEAKAVFNLTLITEPGVTALSNMPIKKSSVVSGQSSVSGKQTAENRQQKTIFETTPRMSTYLLAFVVGEMHKVTAKTKDGVEVNVWSTPLQPLESLDFALKTAVGSIEFFNDYFGTPYPLPKCDHVALPDFSAGAMENWGLVTYREVALLTDPKNTAQSTREWIATVVAHETSHQWFGNLVTMRWWDNLWLNESFATLMEYLAIDALYPEWDIWTTFGNHEAFGAFRRDALPGVQAVKTEVNHPDEISTLFDSAIVYAKGARLLYMLFSYIGEDAFKKGLAEYFASHAYKNTEGKDLWQALSDASGKDIAGFMDPWLNQPGYPVVAATQNGSQLSVSQKQFLFDQTNGEGDGKLWPIPLLPTQELSTDLLDTHEANFTLGSDDYVRLNDAGGSGHYIVRYTQEAHRQAIKDEIKAGEIAATDRMFLLHDSILLSKAGLVSAAETLDMLQGYKSDSSEPVWETIAAVISDVKRIVEDDEESEDLFKNFIADLITRQYQRLGWHEVEGEPASDVKLRSTIIGLGVYAEVTEILDEAKQLFAKTESLESLPAELRPIIFTAAVRHGVPGAFEKLVIAYKDASSSELQQDICAGLTSAKGEDEILQLISKLTDSQYVRLQDVDRWFIYLIRNRWAREASWQWLVDNWQWIEDKFGHDKSYEHLPRYSAASLSTDEWLKRYKEFFEPLMNRPALKRTITIGVSDIESRVAWNNRDSGSIKGFLRNWQAQTRGKNRETAASSPASSTAES
jgi:aminopeptidase N